MPATEFKRLRIRAKLTRKQASWILGYHTSSIYRFDNGLSVPRPSILRELESRGRIENPDSANKGFTFVDLFAGIGGLRIGFEEIGGRCVFTSEWDQFAQQTYMANFPEDQVYGDITQIDEYTIPDHDVLIAGFPCQPFSIAGVSKKNSLGEKHGFAEETQGTLFFDIARIIKAKRPKAFLLENVKNLERHDRGNTFRVIMNILQYELGYHVTYRVIDAQHFLPQHRERIAIVGFREKVNFSWESMSLPEKGLRRMHTILHPEDGSETTDDSYTEGSGGFVKQRYTLSDHLWGYLKRYAAKHKSRGNGFGYGLVDTNDISRTLSARYHKDGSEVLIKQKYGRNPRRLTPRECARLMGFEDWFQIPVSDTQAYRQFGNAAAVPVFREVARIMQPHIFSLADSDTGYQAPFPVIAGI